MKYWLMKTEPSTFGVDHLEKAPKQCTRWDGVRNYQVRNMLRDEMKSGDKAFLYHSSCAVPGVAAIMELQGAGYPDPTAFDRKDDHYDPDSKPDAPRWYAIDVCLKERLPRIVTLAMMREHANKELKGLQLLRAGNRLSIVPVEADQWRFIVSLSRRK